MVRLKAELYLLLVVVVLFQFLMVRLKALLHKEKYTDEQLFQFLMVRLKVHHTVLTKINDLISIPYGSIKRQ